MTDGDAMCDALREAGMTLEYLERQAWMADITCRALVEQVCRALDAEAVATNEQELASAREAHDDARKQYEIAAEAANSIAIAARAMGSTVV